MNISLGIYFNICISSVGNISLYIIIYIIITYEETTENIDACTLYIVITRR